MRSSLCHNRGALLGNIRGIGCGGSGTGRGRYFGRTSRACLYSHGAEDILERILPHGVSEFVLVLDEVAIFPLFIFKKTFQ